jgi:ribosomal protein L11 methyltransferase
LACRAIDVPDEDWAARSQAGLRAVRVARIVVAPPWDVPAAGSMAPAPSPAAEATSGADLHQGRADIVAIIQPSMGFGTGHHETTRLCLELLQEIELAGREVLDVGTGSGVLAIAAALLGARHVRAVDVDDDALMSARENLALNRDALSAAGCTIDVAAGDVRHGLAPADLVLANLTGGALVSSASALRGAVRESGSLLVSGFQPFEAVAVIEALAPPGARVERRRQGDWEAALIQLSEQA